MKRLIFTIQEYINQLLFGISCSGCRKPGFYICKKCLDSIRLSDTTEHSLIYGLYDYGTPLVSHSIWNLKYKHKGQEAKLLIKKASVMVSEIIADHLQSEFAQEIIFVPIPQYKKKTESRGFNQSIVLAKWLSEEIPNSKVKILLEKKYQTLPQSHISNKKMRIKNVEQTMCGIKNIEKDKVYIIIDDVTTTGATFLEAKRALKEVGAKNILCIALAHGYKKR